ncbi:MAG: iron-sulfur cluster assembly protein [Euryarchaeota archaeon]|nr:iron-sulfur cluster assembly protein [Euryarchaeota archaeon]
MVTENQVIEKLKEVMDPHTNTSVYDMNLISGLKINNGDVSLTFTPSSPFCPLGIQLAVAIKRKLMELKEVKKVDVNVVGHVQKDQLNELLKKI